MRMTSLLVILSIIVINCGSGGETNDKKPAESNFKKPNTPISSPEIKFKSIVNCPKGSSITYENFGANFLRSHCTSCHNTSLSEEDRAGAPVTVNLESHFLIQTNRVASLAAVRAGANRNDYHTVREPNGSAAVAWLICGAP